jgi:hypothetical protein
VRRYLAELPQGRKAARVSELFRVRGEPSFFRDASRQPQVDPGNGVPWQQVPLGFHEAVPQRKPQTILVGGQDYGLDHPRTELTGSTQAALVELLAEPVPTVGSQHANDDRGRRLGSRWGAHCAAADEYVTEIRDLEMVTLGAFSYVFGRQLVGRDDDVVYVSPVVECGVAVRLLDP